MNIIYTDFNFEMMVKWLFLKNFYFTKGTQYPFLKRIIP